MDGPHGTQSVQRATAILRIVAARGARGCGLLELSRATGLTPPTTRRMLSGLLYSDILDQDERSRRYFPGLLMLQFGGAAEEHYAVRAGARRVLAALAGATGTTCYLLVRRADEAVCIACAPARSVSGLDVAYGRHFTIGSRLDTAPLASGSEDAPASAGWRDAVVEVSTKGRLIRDLSPISDARSPLSMIAMPTRSCFNTADASLVCVIPTARLTAAYQSTITAAMQKSIAALAC